MPFSLYIYDVYETHFVLKFHQKRRNDPDKYTSRVKNLLTYGVETAKKVIPDPDNKLYKCTRIICDGVDYTDHLKADKQVCLLILNMEIFLKTNRYESMFVDVFGTVTIFYLSRFRNPVKNKIFNFLYFQYSIA